MKVIFSLVALLVLTASTWRFMPEFAFAQSTDDYTYSHTKRNMYEDEVLILNFSDLTPTQVYSITAQQLDLLGNVVNNIETDFFTNLTSTQLIWNTGLHDLPAGPYPFQIVDNFGNVLSRHFMAPAPIEDWQLDTSQTSGNHKQGIASPYIEVNADGWHRNTDHLFSMTNLGSVALFHYTATSTVSTDIIRFRDLETLTTYATISVAELIDYNEDSAFPDPNAANAYIVLNTDGHALEFIDKTASQAAFVSSNDNPHTLTFPVGVYDYPRFTDAGVYLSFGQSTWIVSEIPPGGLEYRMLAQVASVQQAGTQTVNFRQFTEAVHTDYPLQRLTDSALGIVDDNDYEYVLTRNYDFTVSNTLGTQTLTWIWQPVGLSVPAIDPYQFRYEETATYTIVASGTAATTAEEHIGGLLDVFALRSPLGQLIALIATMLASFYGLSKVTAIPLNGRLLIQAFIYVGVGLLFIITGYSSVVTEIIWGMGALFIFVMLMRKATAQNA